MAKASISSNKENENTKKAANFVDRISTELILGDTEALEKGYIARAMVVASMPHSKPKEHVFTRRNGNYTLYMMAPPKIGLPYGAMARLILAWITTEAVRTKSPTLTLGKSLADFMRQLDIAPTGGRKGTITYLREQMKRLFSTSISLDYSNDTVDVGVNMHIVKKYELWWTPKSPEQIGLAESTITLDEEFFNEITRSPVVFFMDALKALRKSPLALDIYMWLTYKNSYAKSITSISWESLQEQFGAGYPMTAEGKANFKKKFKAALKKVAIIYTEAKKIQALDKGLLFIPGLPHVKKTKHLT